ncbi:MAG: group 1 glycosyl transferase, partial [Rikenellaceae bacterium]|nr:group 1 glycosyl transferase [Rikenellaceae bacterium]
MKRALHLLDRIRFGGAESVALNYARSMASWGVRSTLCGKPDSAHFSAFASRYADIRHRIDPKEIRRADYLFVHSNRNLFRLLVLRSFFRLRAKRIVYIQHLPYAEWKFKLLARIINRLCTGFIRITPMTESLVERYIRIPVEFIPNFYLPRYALSERAAIREKVRNRYSIEPGQRIVLFSGALKPGKGLPEFLTLAERFAGSADYRFVVVGDGQQAGLIAAYPHKNLLWT